MKDLIQLRQKWKPVLICKSVISKMEIREYNADVKNYKANNPNWQQEINILHL